ncbi:MAG TPA: hypothetical protein PKC89_09945 [Pyrinomonadaceae bacterium]|nr:hypothetical protein [Pyrinomonadaceae bacterium]
MDKRILLIVSTVVIGVVTGMAQTAKVHIKDFRIDDKPIDCEIKLELKVDGKVFKPAVENGTFIVPNAVKDAKNVVATVGCNSYCLTFPGLRWKNFYADGREYFWQAGIDRYPFTEVSPPPKAVNLIREAHYLRFEPYGLVGIQSVIYIKK